MARLGFLAQLLSRPVLLGYITGVGLTLISSQIGAFTGIAIEADRFFPRFWELLGRLDEVEWRPLLLGAAALALIVGLRWKAPSVPGALAAVTVATIVATAFSLGEEGVALVGPIPRGLPGWAWPAVGRSDVVDLLGVAAGIAIVGYTDNILTARAIARGRGYGIEPNRELFALGAINVASGLGRGFPISSSASRTAVPAMLGSKTQLVGLVGASFLVLSLVALGPAVERIPRAALAAVVLAAAVAIIDARALARLWRQSPPELGLAVITALAVMVVDILTGVLAAVALSVVHAFRRISRPHDSVLGLLDEAHGFVDVEQYPAAHTVPGLLVYRFDAPLFFANTARFRQRLEEALERNPGEESWVILDFEGVGAVDATALDGLEELVVDFGGQGVVVAVARANEPVKAQLDSSGVADLLGPERIYPTINAAVDAFHHRRRRHPTSVSSATHRPCRVGPRPGHPPVTSGALGPVDTACRRGLMGAGTRRTSREATGMTTAQFLNFLAASDGTRGLALELRGVIAIRSGRDGQRRESLGRGDEALPGTTVETP